MQKNLTWDLSEIYSDPKDLKISRDLDALEKKCLYFETVYKGKLNGLTRFEFLTALALYEEIHALSSKLCHYAYLLRSTNFDKADIVAFEKDMKEKVLKVRQNTLFFELEINQIPKEKFDELNQGAVKEQYAAFLNDIINFKPYQLNEDIEKLLQKKIAIKSPWIELYDTTLSNMKYRIEGKYYTEAQAYSKLVSQSRIERFFAGEAINKNTKNKAPLFALSLNTLAKDLQISYELRGLNRPYSLANIENDVKDEDVDALVKAGIENFTKISERYYKFKAELLGLEKMHYWDRNAPYSFIQDNQYSWEEAQEIVRQAYESFSPEFYSAAKNFFDNRWVDVMPKNGKEKGAYAMPMPKEFHPYLLLNFDGRKRDVLTFAHELGHGVHMYFSRNVNDLCSGTSRVMAETASIFGENITFKRLLENEDEPKVKFGLLSSRIEDMLNTSTRQIAFHNFEMMFHEERKAGTVSIPRICEIWKNCMSESFGSTINMDGAEYMWGQIPHFFHSPFYVYSYAFSSCMVNSLFKVYEEGTLPDFEERYINMLKAGGTLNYHQALAGFGIDTSDADFWNKGFDIIAGLIDQLEQIVKEID